VQDIGDKAGDEGGGSLMEQNGERDTR